MYASFIFLGDNNYGILKYKQRIQSQITLPATSGIDEKPDTTVETTTTTAGEAVSGTVVGIFNKDLSTGTVVSLTQSPISIELEATKSLLALKNEGDTTNQNKNQQPLNSSVLKVNVAINKCSVKLTKLSNEDVK